MLELLPREQPKFDEVKVENYDNFYQAWPKIFHAMSGTSTDDDTERIFHAASGKNAVSMRTMN